MITKTRRVAVVSHCETHLTEPERMGVLLLNLRRTVARHIPDMRQHGASADLACQISEISTKHCNVRIAIHEGLIRIYRTVIPDHHADPRQI